MGGGPRPGSGNVIAAGGGSPRWGVPMIDEALGGRECVEGVAPPLRGEERRADTEEWRKGGE